MNIADIQEILRDNYLNPQNYGVPTWKYTHTTSVDNPTCGDLLTLYANIKDNHMEDIAFTASACSICIASASLLYSNLKNRDIIKIPTDEEVIALLGFEPTTSRKNCALLPLFALREIAK
jgi:nitrogen fixation NifU-like protein